MKFFLLGIITIILWYIAFAVLKRYLKKRNMKVEKSKINLVHAIIVCIFFVIGLSIITQKFDEAETKDKLNTTEVSEVEKNNDDVNESSGSKEDSNSFSNEDFYTVMTILFALIPNTLFKQLILGDKSIVYDDAIEK